MKNRAIHIIALLLCSCQPDGHPVLHVHDLPQDTPEYLAERATFIGVVEISGSIDTGRFSRGAEHLDSTVPAIIQTSLKGDLSPTDRISISRSAVKDNFIHALGNGRHLVFLVEHEGRLSPITKYAVMDIQNDELLPIWNRDSGTEELRWSKGTALDEALATIEAALKEKTTEPGEGGNSE